MSAVILRACVLSRFSGVWLFVTPLAVARQAPLSTGFPRQEYWSGLPYPPPGDLPGPGIEPVSPVLAGTFFTAEPPGKLGWPVGQNPKCSTLIQKTRSSALAPPLPSHWLLPSHPTPCIWTTQHSLRDPWRHAVASGLSVFVAAAFCDMGLSYIYPQIPPPPSCHHSTQKTTDKGCAAKRPVCSKCPLWFWRHPLPGFRAPFPAQHWTLAPVTKQKFQPLTGHLLPIKEQKNPPPFLWQTCH